MVSLFGIAEIPTFNVFSILHGSNAILITTSSRILTRVILIGARAWRGLDSICVYIILWVLSIVICEPTDCPGIVTVCGDHSTRS